jgi:hypothetical protein
MRRFLCAFKVFAEINFRIKNYLLGKENGQNGYSKSIKAPARQTFTGTLQSANGTEQH